MSSAWNRARGRSARRHEPGGDAGRGESVQGQEHGAAARAGGVHQGEDLARDGHRRRLLGVAAGAAEGKSP